MTLSPILDPLTLDLREDASVDFCRSCVTPTPMPWRIPTTADGEALHLPDELYQALRASGYAQLRHVEVDIQDDRVILRGQVPTYFLKQFAQSLALGQPGIREVENEIEVVSPR